jgi:hypothetical protein
MKNFNVRNTSSDTKTEHRSSRQKRLQGPMPYHRLGMFKNYLSGIWTGQNKKKK